MSAKSSNLVVFNFTVGGQEYTLRCRLGQFTYDSAAEISKYPTFCATDTTKGNYEHSFSGTGKLDGEDNDLYEAMTAAKAAADPIPFAYGPLGSTAGLPKKTGTFILGKFTIAHRANQPVEVTINGSVVGDDVDGAWA